MTDRPNAPKTGLRKGLATYGDAEFSLFMRRVFIKAMGYTDDALDRPIIGITDTYSDFNPCHGNVPDLIEATKRGRRLDETKPGSGLGLSIVVDLAGLYGGSFVLEDSPLGGLRARLTLPAL